MANWLHQLQSLLGQQGASPSGESSKGSGLLPGMAVEIKYVVFLSGDKHCY
ncbi:hypothetical protein ACMWDM_21070, partial [Klebsiella pneumoniae]